jgi:hypothetical protein
MTMRIRKDAPAAMAAKIRIISISKTPRDVSEETVIAGCGFQQRGPAGVW